MRFQPRTEQELEQMTLIEPGTYQFLVSTASNERSKSGNDMIKLTLTVWDKTGGTHTLFDYLLEAMAYKLRHFCSVAGLMNKYEKGELTPEDCMNKGGCLEIVIQDGKDKPEGGKYPDRNAVKDYVTGQANKFVASSKASVLLHEDEDVPF